MNKIGLFNQKIYFRQKIWITIIFFLLVVIHDGLIVSYIKKVLDTLNAKIVTRTLVQSRMHMLVEALEPLDGAIQIDQVIDILDGMLMLEGSETGTRFITGVKLEMDYDFVTAQKKSLDIERGKISGDNFLIPIYSKNTKELIGIIKFYSTQLSLKKSRKKFELAMLVGAFLILLIAMFVLWYILTRLFVKIKKTENALKEKQAQLIHTGRLKAMGEMAAGIAHEMNQPLQVIKSAAPYLNEYFAKHAPKSEEAEAAQDIIKHVNRVTDIIKNMISFVRKKPQNIELIDLHAPLNKALSFFKEQFKNHEIYLDMPYNSPDTNLPKIKTNLQEFMQIVVNLLSNARDALDKKGEKACKGYKKKVILRLFFDSRKNVIVFEVKDNGIGMTTEVKERCMEPFYTTKEVGEGTGLGLSIVHNLARKHGMQIEIDSTKGEGTTFRILIPPGA